MLDRCESLGRLPQILVDTCFEKVAVGRKGISSCERVEIDERFAIPLQHVERGPTVTQGYRNRPDENATVMLPEGWLKTGDIGRIDDEGFVYLEDRKKDMITVSGFKVYPNEVEDVAAKLPGVFESAAVGQADEKSGEVVALYVVRKDPNLTAEALITHMRQHLTSYKVPRHVYFRTALPKTNVGKILRRALR